MEGRGGQPEAVVEGHRQPVHGFLCREREEFLSEAESLLI